MRICYTAGNNKWKRLTDSREWPNATCLVRGTIYAVADRAEGPYHEPEGGLGQHQTGQDPQARGKTEGPVALPPSCGRL